MIDISVIVPAYNVERYISQCLDSLINQTKKELEIPPEMLDGDKNIKEEKQYEPKETTYEWEYGTVKKYQTKAEGVDLSQFRAGVTVYHKKFGEGVINSVEQEGEDLKLDINFEKAGHKRLMAKFANLEII